ncbi:MAG: glycosyl hydrolase, partial [Candidatus Dormibacteraceae bacterium]
PNVLYHGGNRLFRSPDEGQTWEPISPDLSRNDPATQRSSGGPVTADNTGAEYYGCIFALAESRLERGLLWVGTDDGLVHVSRDAGATWTACTPRDFPEWAHVSTIEASPHAAGTAFVVADAHRLDDPRPYLWRTRDYGATWERLDRDLPGGEFCHVLRQDPEQPHLLYCGTEAGAYVSLDDGATWQSLRGNLPLVAIHDLIIEGDDLVAATHGRSIWILDDLAGVRQHRAELREKRAHLYRPRTAVRYPVANQLSGDTVGVRDYKFAGTAIVAFDVRHGAAAGETDAVPVDAGVNRPDGVTVLYWLRDAGEDDVELSFLDGSGEVVRTFRSTAANQKTPPPERPKEPKPAREAGLNHFTWDTRHDPGTRIERDPPKERGIPEQAGPRVPPGTYTVRLTLGDLVLTEPCLVLEDPRNPATAADLGDQYALARRLWQMTSDLNQGVNRIRDLKLQLAHWCEEGRPEEIGSKARALRDTLTDVERELVQVEAKGSLRLSNPDRLDGKLRSLQRFVEAPARPPRAAHTVADELAEALERALGRLRTAIDTDLADFNRLLVQTGTDAVTPAG